MGTVARSRQFGTERLDFEMEGCRAMMLAPIRPAHRDVRPWIFCAPVFVGPHPSNPDANPNLFNHPIADDSPRYPPADRPDRATHEKLFRALLERGFHIGGIEVGESMGNPAGCGLYSVYCRHVVQAYGLDPRPCLYATSRGALMLYNWAADRPESLRCIGANQPVMDLALFPGLDEAAKAYAMPADEFRMVYKRHNPIDRLSPLAAIGVPILHIVGEADELLPFESVREMKRRYTALGGHVRIISHAGVPHGLWPELLEDMRMYDFFVLYAGLS